MTSNTKPFSIHPNNQQKDYDNIYVVMMVNIMMDFSKALDSINHALHSVRKVYS